MRRTTHLLIALLTLLVLAAAAALASAQSPPGAATGTPAGPWPTATLPAGATRPPAGPWPTATPGPTGTALPRGVWPTATATRPRPTPTTDPNRLVPTQRQRFGVYGTNSQFVTAWSLGLRAGSLIGSGLDFWTPLPAGTQRWQVVRVSMTETRPPVAGVRRGAATVPGSVWVIGNEPDVIWQDNVTPERYAAAYHELYTAIKAADPSALVAIAGVATPTPLRRQYLDLVLNAYRRAYGVPLPVDIFTVHSYVLNEQRASWGAEIPPGMSWVNAGNVYEVADHGDVTEITGMIVAFRQWMAQRGYRNVPLAVTEFGILMPADYGYPPNVVNSYMRQMIAFFQTAGDPAVGYPADENRLVQWWFWYSLNDHTGEFSNSDLYDRTTGRLTPLGLTYSGYWR